jgi:type II secretory pathway predicted ATPase ExeA
MAPSKDITDGVERLKRFRKIILEHPRLGKIRTKIAWLLATTADVVTDNELRREAAKGRSIKCEERWVLPILGPSGSMKSTSIRKIVDEINSDPDIPEDDIPVVVVSLREVKTTRAFLGSFLDHYGDAAADAILKSGPIDAQVVTKAIYFIARARRTMLLIVDEAHEMLRHDGGKVGKAMAMLLKTMVNDGVFSIVLLGTDEMLPLFHSPQKDKPSELRSRCVMDEEVTLQPFDIRKAEDRKYFFSFLKRLEIKMVEDGVVDHALGWVDSIEDRAKIYDMSLGILGIACRVLRNALERALRDGRTSLEWHDIEAAFRAYNRMQTVPGFDPFVNGPKKETLGRLKAAAAEKPKKAVAKKAGASE